MVLPAGSAVPPLPALLVLVVATAVVAVLVRRRDPAFTPRIVLAFVPWMVTGAALHVLHRLAAAPDAIDPFLGTPAVYVTTFVVAGATWLAADRTDRGPLVLATVGTLAAITAVTGVLATADRVSLAWPAVGLVVSSVLAGVTWRCLGRVSPRVTSTTGAVGGLVVFAHALDGVSTAIGVDVLGFSERTPVSRVILDTAAALPGAEVLGAGWLFVAVKVGVAVLVLTVFDDYVREDPRPAYLLLAVIAAVGLGPATNNLLLYAVG